MGVYKCNFDEINFIETSIPIECASNEIRFHISSNGSSRFIYLNFENVQKLAKELNQLLMEGEGNE